MCDELGMNDYLVAFIDLLGFGDKLLSASSDAELKVIYKDLQFVHDTFGKDPKDRFQKHEMEASKRFILSLSDSLVIAIALDSQTSKIMGTFDNWCDQIHTIGINQAICAANGIFLRGGVSKGQFYLSRDILLSQAQVQAYKIENQIAKFPVICFHETASNFFIEHKDNRYYSPEYNPTKRLFMRYTPRPGEDHYCIDYIRIGLNAAYEEFTLADREEWKKTEGGERDAVREKIALKHAKRFIVSHKEAIVKELKLCRDFTEPSVLQKYVWLSRYHNEAAIEWFPNDPECLVEG